MTIERQGLFPRRQQRLVVAGGSGSSGTTGSSGGCGCACIDAGDIVVNTIETTSKWSVTLLEQRFRQTYGTIKLPSGTYVLVWNIGRSLWVLDIGSSLTAEYLDASDATADTTMDGEITFEWTALGAAPTLKLCVDGTVPDPGS